MSRLRLALVAVFAALVLAAPVSAMAPVKLTAVVGPAFNISLTKGGKKVTKLAAGTYVITVSDRSAIHNFHLLGPGLSKKTSVPAKGTSTWTLKLKKGAYRYVCDPHVTVMKGSFTVS